MGPTRERPELSELELITGKERDSETNLDYFGARYYSGAQGRFTTPDWSTNPQPVPYANLSDPQSLNLYAYMYNNPLSGVDAEGHAGSCKDDPGLCKAIRDAHGDIDAGTAAYNHAQGKEQGPTIGPLPKSNGNTIHERVGGMVGGLINSALDLADQLPGINHETIASLKIWPSSQDEKLSQDVGGFLAVMLPLPKAAQKILGGLAPLAETKAASAVRLRGGGAAQVGEIATYLQQMQLGDVARAAAGGDREAVKAIKIVKDAARLAQK